MFAWAEPGVYDHREYYVRYVLGENGMPTITISKMWLDRGGPEDVDASLKLPWGTYPDMPPKPVKK